MVRHVSRLCFARVAVFLCGTNAFAPPTASFRQRGHATARAAEVFAAVSRGADLRCAASCSSTSRSSRSSSVTAARNPATRASRGRRQQELHVLKAQMTDEEMAIDQARCSDALLLFGRFMLLYSSRFPVEPLRPLEIKPSTVQGHPSWLAQRLKIYRT